MQNNLFKHDLILSRYLCGEPKIESAGITKLLKDFPGKRICKKLYRAEIDGFPYRRSKRRIFSASETEYGAVTGAYSMFRHYLATIEELQEFKKIAVEDIRVNVFTLQNPYVIISFKELVKFHGVEYKPFQKFLGGVCIESLFKEKEYLVSAEHSKLAFSRKVPLTRKKFQKIINEN